MNLKKTLMELGNNLVLQHGYTPAACIGSLRLPAEARTTAAIAILTEFINNSEEARQELQQMGIEWPVVPKQNSVLARKKALEGFRLLTSDQVSDHMEGLKLLDEAKALNPEEVKAVEEELSKTDQ